MTPIFSCHGYEITTVEGVGNRIDGYHEIQNRLAKFNGAQCGYCSPGYVMSMYALVQRRNGKVTQTDVVKALDGNVCRCTGYRSIFDAFKSLASDADQTLVDRCADIEDLGKICSKSRTRRQKSSGWLTRSGDISLEVDGGAPSILLKFDRGAGKEWIKVVSLNELFTCLAEIGDREYQLVAGNTSNGDEKLN